MEIGAMASACTVAALAETPHGDQLPSPETNHTSPYTASSQPTGVSAEARSGLLEWQDNASCHLKQLPPIVKFRPAILLLDIFGKPRQFA